MSPFFFFTLLFSLLLLFLPFSSPSRSSPCPYYPTHTILGVQHSGTTTVHGMLEKCVDLCYVKKELHVLDKLRVLDIRLLYQEEEKVCEKYKSLISTNKTKNCLAIDISPSYAVSTVASQYFSQYLPNIKQAVILREPLDRVLSVMNHRCCNKLSNKLSVESSKAAVLEGIHEDYLKFVETYSHTEKTGEFGLQKFQSTTFTKSWYDMLHYTQYPNLEEGEGLWLFDELKYDCPSFVKRLANFVDRPEIEGCLLTQCGLKLNSCDAHCFTREEIPKEVVRIVKEKNHWWYKERRKERNL